MRRSVRVAENLISKGMWKNHFVGVTGNLMLWVSGHDIGDRNKEFIGTTLNDSPRCMEYCKENSR